MVPPTIHSLLAARLDRLPEASKQLALTAAVVGLESSGGSLSRLGCTVEDRAWPAHVAALRRPGSADGARCGAKRCITVLRTHLLQEVAYSSLLRCRPAGHATSALPKPLQPCTRVAWPTMPTDPRLPLQAQ